MPIIEVGDKKFIVQPCKNCESDTIEYVHPQEPWYNEHWMCNECCSTFPMFDEEIAKPI